ncbi:MAG: protein kinase, partial [Myxococcales bacterium]|nr:protein kinase [Myxococcales bacterium]
MSDHLPERERKAGRLADVSLEIEIVVEDPLDPPDGELDTEIVIEDPLDPPDDHRSTGTGTSDVGAARRERTVESVELEPLAIESVELEPIEVEPVELESLEVEPVELEVEPVELEVEPVELEPIESIELDPVDIASVERAAAGRETRGDAAARELAAEDSFEARLLGKADTVRLPAMSGRLGEYRIVRRLGEGGMGQVFEALDTRTGQRVALKMLFDVEPENVYRLKREFRRMADIVHQNLVTLYELVVDNDLCFFTMEYVPGVDFYSALA